MTKDVIALTPQMPDTWALLAGLYAGGPDLDVGTAHEGAVIQLRNPAGRPLVSVEAPLLVHLPSEAQRLLGSEAPDPGAPFWWTEARASTAVPEAEPLAGSLCGRLTTLLGGTTWPPSAATTQVIPTPDDADKAVTAHPAPDGALPAVDVLTDSTAVVIADRPVIPLTAWLSDILRATTASGRALHIVTPHHARLSLPLRTALTGAPNRWVIQHPDCGYYDGLSGAVLRWQDGTFAPALTADGQATVAAPFTQPGIGTERQLIVSLRTHHDADEDLILGRPLETAWHRLAGTPPTGWGPAEPINLPWSTRQLTELARGRAPEPTHILAIGHPDRPAIATLRISRTATGIAQDTTLALGYGEDTAPPLDSIEALAETLITEHGLTTMLTSVRRARRDLTIPPQFEAPPIPTAFTLGPSEVNDIGLSHARRPPLNLRPTQLGTTSHPALHYPLGDNTDAEAWTTLQQLTEHLKATPGPTRSPR
ncbi:DUF6177 family protein [Streptomyces sp. Je 1-332]|uniref:DUF6177 family protein n=1 Tax=Streptomyces sp. Je 1-332 TaxID=3231270 RepID=UPI0034574878